jgi:uncharacterized protein (TIGR03083 family)
MEIAQHIEAVAHEGKMFAEAAQQAGFEADIATCPGWNMRDLVRHLSEIHMWAAAHVAKPHFKPWIDDLSELTAFWPALAIFWPDDDALIEQYLATNTNLVHALESAPPDLDTFTFLPAPSPLAMWARRQAHETAVHRFDAEKAAGIASSFDPVLASDGVDELLAGFAPRKPEFPVGTIKTMHVHAVDTDDHWYMTLSPDGVETSRDPQAADVVVRGTASDLYLLFWNRTEDATVTVTGESELLQLWHGNVRVRWS